MTLSWPFLDDTAPPGRKTLWFSILACITAVAVAVGYIGGGTMAATYGWRSVFFMEAGAGVLIALFAFLVPSVNLRSPKGPSLQQATSLTELICNPLSAGGRQEDATSQDGCGRATPCKDKAAAVLFSSTREEPLLAAPSTPEVLLSVASSPENCPQPATCGSACSLPPAPSAGLQDLDGHPTEAAALPGTPSSSDARSPPALCRRLGCAFRSRLTAFWAAIRVLCEHPAVLLNNFGFAPIQGVIGFLAFFSPKFGVDMFDITPVSVRELGI